jgi:hypothetical protein
VDHSMQLLHRGDASSLTRRPQGTHTRQKCEPQHAHRVGITSTGPTRCEQGHGKACVGSAPPWECRTAKARIFDARKVCAKGQDKVCPAFSRSPPTTTRVLEPASAFVESCTVGQRGGSGERRFNKVSGNDVFSIHVTRSPSATRSRLTPHTVSTAGASQTDLKQTQDPARANVRFQTAKLCTPRLSCYYVWTEF